MLDEKILLIIIISIFGIALLFLFFPRKKKPSSETLTSHYSISSRDIRAVAGEDVLATQLDLARAYIEMGRKNLAKNILMHVAENGNEQQQHEAKNLMEHI